MKYNYCLILIIAVCLFASYSNLQKFYESLESIELAEIVNDYVNKAQNRGLINEKNLPDRVKNLLVPDNSTQEQTKILDDNSKIQTMYDGFGNKTETRCFINHPRLTCIVLSSAANGERQVLVYGQNGDIKKLPENMLDQVATASGDEIANSAGIYAARPPPQPENAQTTSVPILPTTLKPTENNQASSQNLPSEQIETENIANSEPPTAGSKIKSSPTVGNTKPKGNERSSPPDRQPEEEK